jgi:hypothetical protein
MTKTQHPLEEVLTGQDHSMNLMDLSVQSENPQKLGSNEMTLLGLDWSDKTIIPLRGGRTESRDTDPQKEKPVHRMMAYMAVTGKTNVEIAEETGYSKQRVSQILSAPETRALIAKLVAETHGDDISDLLKGAALDGLLVIKSIACDEKASDSVRLKAAADLVDRWRGKSVQHIQTSHSKVPVDSLEEVEKLQAELKTL